MNNAIIFLLIAIILLSIMLTININISFDLYGNYIKIVIKIWNIEILKIYVSIIGLYIKVNNSKKLKTLNLLFDKNQEYLILQMKKSIFDKLYFDKINIISVIGLSNSSTSVYVTTILNLICNSLKNNKKLNLKSCDIEYENKVSFTSKVVYVNLQIKVLFTLFDMLFAIIMSFYKRGKYAKERKRKFGK